MAKFTIKFQKYFSIINFFFLQNSELSGYIFNIRNNFLLHEIETHGQQCDTEQQIHRTQCNRQLWIFFGTLGWDKVTEACYTKWEWRVVCYEAKKKKGFFRVSSHQLSSMLWSRSMLNPRNSISPSWKIKTLHRWCNRRPKIRTTKSARDELLMEDQMRNPSRRRTWNHHRIVADELADVRQIPWAT